MAALRAGFEALPVGGNTDIWARNLPPQNVGASGNSSQRVSCLPFRLITISMHKGLEASNLFWTLFLEINRTLVYSFSCPCNFSWVHWKCVLESNALVPLGLCEPCCSFMKQDYSTKYIGSIMCIYIILAQHSNCNNLENYLHREAQ